MARTVLKKLNFRNTMKKEPKIQDFFKELDLLDMVHRLKDIDALKRLLLSPS